MIKLFPQFFKASGMSIQLLNLAHYFPYDVKLPLLAHSRNFLANQKARNAIVGAENLLKADKPRGMLVEHEKNFKPRAAGEWLTNSSSVLPTSQVVYQPITHRKRVAYCFYIIVQKTRDFSVGLTVCTTVKGMVFRQFSLG